LAENISQTTGTFIIETLIQLMCLCQDWCCTSRVVTGANYPSSHIICINRHSRDPICLSVCRSACPHV
jgi:hypothetical protein